MIYKAEKQEPYLSFVLNGTKTVEGRLNKGKFKEMKAGDTIKTSGVNFLIIEKNIYKTFKEMIEREGIKNVIPDKNNIKDAVDIYYKFYTKEQEKEFGVVAIKIKKMSS